MNIKKKDLASILLLALAGLLLSACGGATTAYAAGQDATATATSASSGPIVSNSECEVLQVGTPDYETVLGTAVYTADVAGTCFRLPEMGNAILYTAPVRNGDLALLKTTDENGVSAYHGDGTGLGRITVTLQVKDGALQYGFTDHMAPAYRADEGYKLSVNNHEDFNNPAIPAGYYIGCNATDCRVDTPIQVIPNNKNGKVLSVQLYYASNTAVNGCGATVSSISEPDQNGIRTVVVAIKDYCTELTFIVSNFDSRHLAGIVGEAVLVPTPES